MLTEDQIKKLKDEHGNALRAFKCPGDDERIVVIRPATGAEWKRFRHQIGGGKTNTAEALDQLCKPCFVFPDDAELRSIGERWPAFVSTLHTKIQELSGAVDELEGKDL